MPVRYYIVPMIGTGARRDPNRPAYKDDPAVVTCGFNWSGPKELACIWIDAPNGYLNTVSAQPDTVEIARQNNLDSALSAGQAAALEAALDALYIPDSLVDVGRTRREVFRSIYCYFQFAARGYGIFRTTWKQRQQPRAVDARTEWRNTPTAFRDDFLAVRGSFKMTDLEVPTQAVSPIGQLYRAASDVMVARKIAAFGAFRAGGREV